MGMLLLARDATVTYCHSKTTDLAGVVREADIVVAAVGRPELIKGNWIKPGAQVIDAGYNPGNIGDVEYTAAAQRARLITPVPGGVGPTTIAVLLAQTVKAAESAHSLAAGRQVDRHSADKLARRQVYCDNRQLHLDRTGVICPSRVSWHTRTWCMPTVFG